MLFWRRKSHVLKRNMEIYHCDIMTSKREKMKIIAAAIGAILMEEGGGIAIKRSDGRETGALWSYDHRMASTGKVPLIFKRSSRSSRR